MLKRIINGKTYNTETATLLAEEAFHPSETYKFDKLYQTRHGAYFRYHGDWQENNHIGEPLCCIEPLAPSEAQAWMEHRDFTMLLEKHFGEQPEAGEAESRVTLRIPDALKSRIETMAASRKQSLNTWIMRCVENCAFRQDASAS